MGAFDRPGGKGVWTQNYLPPGPPSRWKINWGNSLTAGIAFFFLPSVSGYRDVVRGDIMNLFGTNTSALTPFGRSWILGSTAGSVSGYASTAGGDIYYRRSPSSMTIMVGAYNPSAIVNATNAFFGRWSDNSNDSVGNALTVQLANSAGTPRMATNVIVGGSNGFVFASGGAGITMATSGQGMTFCGTYNGATIGAYYSSTALGFGSGTTAKTGAPTGIDRVVLSDTSVGTANRCILWAAGWFGVLTLAQITSMVATNGGLPSGLLRRA